MSAEDRGFKVSIQQAQFCISVSWLLSMATYFPSIYGTLALEKVSDHFLKKEVNRHLQWHKPNWNEGTAITQEK